jgi:DNA-binding helix-hairpin-helix protein with protein kinase domain
MQVRRKSTGQIITLNVAGEFGKGGEARVFPVYGDDKVVAKIYYHPDYKRLRKLHAMLTNPPEDPTKASGRVSIAWPVEILFTPNGKEDFLGFVMPPVTGLRPLIVLQNQDRESAFFDGHSSWNSFYRLFQTQRRCWR